MGGQQHLAFHEKTSRLYSITHQGKHGVSNTAKDPGQEVWIYDIRKKKRTQKISLRRIANSIQVSKDAKPLLFAAYVGVNEIDIYDAMSGDYLRTVNEVGFTPTALQVY